MLKKILSAIVLMFIVFLPFEVSARCSNSEINRLSSLAKNVSITYNYVEENGQVFFHVILSNLQPDFYIKDVYNEKDHYYTSDEIILFGYTPNTSYRFDVYGGGECNQRLYSHYVNIPGYNPYYSTPICSGVNHSICQKWVNINYDYDTFVKEVNKIKQQNVIIEKPKEEEVLGIYDYIIKFFVSYYYIILPVIIITCLIIIHIKRKKDDLF